MSDLDWGEPSHRGRRGHKCDSLAACHDAVLHGQEDQYLNLVGKPTCPETRSSDDSARSATNAPASNTRSSRTNARTWMPTPYAPF